MKICFEWKVQTWFNKKKKKKAYIIQIYLFKQPKSLTFRSTPEILPLMYSKEQEPLVEQLFKLAAHKYFPWYTVTNQESSVVQLFKLAAKKYFPWYTVKNKTCLALHSEISTTNFIYNKGQNPMEVYSGGITSQFVVPIVRWRTFLFIQRGILHHIQKSPQPIK